MLRSAAPLTLLVSLAALAACSDAPPGVVPAEQGVDAGALERASQPDRCGTITGRVVFVGQRPEEERFNVSSDQYYSSRNPDGIVNPQLEVNEDGTVPHVALEVRGPVADPDRHPVPIAPVTIVLDGGAQYVPHVAAVRAGQPVRFENRAYTCM